MTKVLAESGAELSYEELLDAIWLAGKLPRDAGPLARAVVSAIHTERPDTSHSDTLSSLQSQNVAPEDSAGPAAADPTDTEPARPLLAAAQPHACEDADMNADATSIPVIAVRAPDNRPTSTRQLQLSKSLRPLRRRFPDRRRHEVDITRTVAAMADTGVPETVTRPMRTRWLSLALVIDDGISMVLWQRLAAEIRALMERAGAFRDVRVYGLDTRCGTPYLRTSPFRHSGRPQPPKTLSDPTGNTLVLVISDGVGEAWRDGGMRQVMDRWARCGPTAIIQALPTRLWASSGIGAQRWRVTTTRRGGPTHAWHVTDPNLPSDLVSFDAVPVPVLEPTPTALADWARFIAAPGGTALLSLWNSGRTGSRQPTADNRRGDTAEAVLRFREAASPEAYRLAAHLAAVSPVTPPVMRLVQTALGPPTDPGHLMEVFLGGLMHQLTTDEPDRLPHHRRFDFSSDARRTLLSAVSPKELLRTTEAVTRRIEAAVGRAPVFPAWVGHSAGATIAEDTGRSFGWLREQLLTRLGIPSSDAGKTVPAATGPDDADAADDQSGQSSRPGEPPHTQAGALPSGWVSLLPQDPVRLGRFQLQARSAQGWSHMVMYLALDEDGTTVTVRAPSRVHSWTAKTAQDLINTEAECLLRMGGTYAPAILDVQAHTAHEPPWIAATCIHRRADDPSSGPAPNLRAVLDEHGGPVPEEIFLRIGRALADAVHRAHSLGLVHGGLAPRAVLVTDRDVRLVGWTTATVDGIDSAHRAGFPFSDVFESGDDEPSLTPQSDVYALGALLLAFLAGQWGDPRDSSSGQSRLATSSIDPALLQGLWSCMEPEPARRPSAADLVTAFEAVPNTSAVIRPAEKSLETIASEVEQRRLLSRRDMGTHGPELARLLKTFSNHLVDTGRWIEALAPIQEAVEVYRRLASEDKQAFTADLATTLSNLSVRLGEAGQDDESLNAISEAETLYQALTRQDFEAFGPGHAMILNNLSNRLAKAGRLQQAITAIDQAVDINRRLVHLELHAYGADLARSLTNLGNRLSTLGRHEQALRAIAEAVRRYRQLSTGQVSRVWADFAVSLNNHAVLLGDLGSHQEAMTALEESLVVQRRHRQLPSRASNEIREQSMRIEFWLNDLLARSPEQ
ncbi:protein kinase family protein [Streptomyces sp. NPDC039016]|uniref:protein kinase family protein n=1 Tax=Streptomyces sp. NPDC039016 TaxID=3154330 RepID=UPI0033C5C944